MSGLNSNLTTKQWIEAAEAALNSLYYIALSTVSVDNANAHKI